MIHLYYTEKGQGKPLILLHGNGEDGSYFESQMDYFSKTRRVITVDTRGHGRSPRGTAPFTIRQFAEDLRGFMEEKEANFIAFLACTGSERPDFRYSGYLSGWVYCMNALYRTDPEVWQEVRETLAPEAEPDLASNNAFWDRYEGVISETSDLINDTYLKANGQIDGVRSYDRMVDLIVAYHSRS